MKTKKIAAFFVAIGVLALLPLSSSFAKTGWIVLSSYFLPPNSSFSVTGHDFSADQPITVSAGNTAQNLTADNSGNFTSASFTVPYSATGKTIAVSAGGATAKLSVAGFYPVVTPSSYYIIPGNSVTFSGRGFAPNEDISVNGVPTGNIKTDGSGNFSTQPMPVPDTGGSYPIEFKGALSGASASTTINVAVLHPWIILSSYYDKAGNSITIDGHGFGGNEPVDMTFGNSSFGQAITSGNGDFSISGKIPSGGATQHLIATGADSETATASFTLAQ